LVTVLFAPISGASINPARSFGTAVSLLHLSYLWIYFIGPISGAVIAVYLFRVAGKEMKPICSKLCYKTDAECLFKCKCEYKNSL
ncbi:aquaporin, partial [candidate division KSB1 bacterium]